MTGDERQQIARAAVATLIDAFHRAVYPHHGGDCVYLLGVAQGMIEAAGVDIRDQNSLVALLAMGAKPTNEESAK